MPLGIDLALVRSLKDIDPEHLSVSHWSAVSGLGTLKIQYDWSGDPSPSNCRPEWGVCKSKYIISLWLTVANLIANGSAQKSVRLHHLCACCIYIELIYLHCKPSFPFIMYLHEHIVVVLHSLFISTNANWHSMNPRSYLQRRGYVT